MPLPSLNDFEKLGRKLDKQAEKMGRTLREYYDSISQLLIWPSIEEFELYQSLISPFDWIRHFIYVQSELTQSSKLYFTLYELDKFFDNFILSVGTPSGQKILGRKIEIDYAMSGLVSCTVLLKDAPLYFGYCRKISSGSKYFIKLYQLKEPYDFSYFYHEDIRENDGTDSSWFYKKDRLFISLETWIKSCHEIGVGIAPLLEMAAEFFNQNIEALKTASAAEFIELVKAFDSQPA